MGHPLRAQLSGGSLPAQISAPHPAGRGRWQQLLQRYGAVTAHPGRQRGHPIHHTGCAGWHRALQGPPQWWRRPCTLTLFIRSTVVLSRKRVLTLMLCTLSLVKSSASSGCFLGCWEGGGRHRSAQTLLRATQQAHLSAPQDVVPGEPSSLLVPTCPAPRGTLTASEGSAHWRTRYSIIASPPGCSR